MGLKPPWYGLACIRQAGRLFGLDRQAAAEVSQPYDLPEQGRCQSVRALGGGLGLP